MSGSATERDGTAAWTREQIERRVRELGPWFHNIDLGGVRTAPEHFLGDYPAVKWNRFAHAIPEDLAGSSVLDMGCNAGFYAIEMKKRGAGRVLAVDTDPGYLAQGRFAAAVRGYPDIEFAEMSVYDVAALAERFDVVLFLGVLYHLRHPLLALDLLHACAVREGGTLVFQSMQRGSRDIEPVQDDYDFWEMDHFHAPGYPKLHFIENRYCADETNWWVPNRACTEAMLRSAGFEILDNPEAEVYVCRRRPIAPWPNGPRVVPASRRRGP